LRDRRQGGFNQPVNLIAVQISIFLCDLCVLCGSIALFRVTALTHSWLTCSSRQERIESELLTRFKERLVQTVRSVRQARCRLQANQMLNLDTESHFSHFRHSVCALPIG